MLTRIYGTAFHSKEDLEQYLHQLEEARARDHRKLGRDLDLFLFSELSPGSPFWQPNGMAMLNQLTEPVARGERRPRLPRGQDADPLRRRACGSSPATGTCTATTCTSRTSRAIRWA